VINASHLLQIQKLPPKQSGGDEQQGAKFQNIKKQKTKKHTNLASS
jgi:hypothetical protein